MNRLQQLFSTTERVKILEAVLNTTEPVKVGSLAKRTGVNKSLVSIYLRFLFKNLIVKRGENGFLANLEYPVTRSLKVVSNLEKIDLTMFRQKWISGAGLYGSYANGTNTDESDIDIWVKVKNRPKEIIVAALEGKLGKRAGKPVHILVLDKEKISNLKRTNLQFYNTLLYSSIILWGESLEQL